MEFEVLPGADALARRAADRVVEIARAAIAERGRFTIAVSGGSTPAAMFRVLAQAELAWDRVHVFQVDERVAPDGHADRNLTALRDNLVDRVALPEANLHPMPVTAHDLEAAARDYAAELHAAGAVLDLVHLGIGDDGHAASWPPGDPVVEVTDADVAVVGPFNGRVRLTLTPPPVNRARAILWLVAGADKAPMVERLRAGDPAIPASRARRDRAAVFAAL